MAVVNLSPIFVGGQFFDNTGKVLSGGMIYTYAAGTSTPLATYTTTLGTITNANPIVLDSAGRPPAEIWLVQANTYKFVLTDSLSNVLATLDDIKGINDLNNVTIAGTLTVFGNASFVNLSTSGNTTIGDASGDGLIVNPAAINWPGNPTHTGNHTFSGNVTVGGNETVTGNLGVTTNLSVTGTTTTTGVVTQNANPAGKVVGNVFTPTLTNSLNVSASTARQCQYIRVGPQVMYCGYFTATTTAAGSSIVKVSLPIPTTAGGQDFTGSMSVDVAASNGGFALGDGLGALQVQWSAAAGATFNVSFSVMYLVI